MYQLFDLNGRNIGIQGYHFPCENPHHVVVLIHGIGEHAGRYSRLAEFYNNAGIAIVSMDLRGHGRTEGKRGHCAPRSEVLGDIDALIEEAQRLYPDVPIVMYGHSMGGNITLDYRARGGHNDAVCGYIVSAPWIRLCRNVGKFQYNLVKMLSSVMPSFTIKQSFPEEYLGNLKYVRPYNDDPLVHPNVSLLCAYEGFSIGTAIEKGENESNGRADDVPFLLMHGDKDKICSVEGSKNFAKLQKSPSFRFEIMKDYPHELHNGNQDGKTGEEVIQMGIDFINSL